MGKEFTPLKSAYFIESQLFRWDWGNVSGDTIKRYVERQRLNSLFAQNSPLYIPRLKDVVYGAFYNCLHPPNFNFQSFSA